MGYDPLQLMTEMFGDVVVGLTQEQALADGVLVALPADLTREAGIMYPVVVTAAVHAQVIAWAQGEATVNPEALQDEAGRMWDLLVMLHHAIAANLDAKVGDRVPVEVLIVPADRPDPDPALVQLHAVLTVETGSPSLVVMTPYED